MEYKADLAFPETFEFPLSFEYHVNVGQMAVPEAGAPYKRDKKVYQSKQNVILDGENNRIRIDKLNMFFIDTDREVRVYDFGKLRVLVSDPDKQMCIQQKISDLSPMSVVPRD